MKKMLVAFALLLASANCFAEDMKGKLGVGIRGEDFDVRYFAAEKFGLHAGTSLDYTKVDSGEDSRSGKIYLGAFYNHEVEDGIFLQAGMLVGYNPGNEAGKYYHAWYFNPFIGAEAVYKKRFAIDFKIMPVQYARDISTSMGSSKYWSSLHGSLGAHYYF